MTPGKEIVWEYVSPISSGKLHCSYEDAEDHNAMRNMIHRAFRYGKDYPGLKGKDLSKKTPLAPDCPEFWKIYKLDK